MLARVVEFAPNSDAAAQFVETVEATVLRIVRTQNGCIAAFLQVRGEVIVGLSFWESTSAAERYSRSAYTDIVNTLRPMLKCAPKVCMYEVPNFLLPWAQPWLSLVSRIGKRQPMNG